MITILTTDKETPEITSFFNEEWKYADYEYFGREVNWKRIKLFILAQEHETTVGALELTIQAGVMHIDVVVVKHTHQEKGIGKLLMQKAEEIAKEKKAHKIYFETGKAWRAATFYEKLGYIKTADLPNHAEGQDYVIYTKFIL